MGSGKDIFKGKFNFATYDARKKLNITYSLVQRAEYRYISPSTQEYQKLENKLKQDLTEE